MDSIKEDKKLSSCERIKAALDFRQGDHIPITENCFWPDTLKRWRREGLPKDVDIYDYLRLDRIYHNGPFDCSLSKVFPHKIFEETEEYIIDQNPYGVKVKYWKNRYTTHLELDHAIQERKDWEKVKDVLDVSNERMKEGFVEEFKEARERGDFLTLGGLDAYWFSFVMLGMKNFMQQMALDPDFIHDICQTYTDFLVEMFEKTVNAGVEWDGIWFFSDMAYRNGPMFSPEYYQIFFQPHYQLVSNFCKKHGKYFLIHSDGNVEKLIPGFIESGFNAVQPLEARAGNDVRKYKNMFGEEICLFGNISADILAKGNKEEIEEEIRSKVLKAKEGGGYIYHSDHSIPPTISLENFCFAIECAKKYGQF